MLPARSQSSARSLAKASINSPIQLAKDKKLSFFQYFIQKGEKKVNERRKRKLRRNGDVEGVAVIRVKKGGCNEGSKIFGEEVS